MSDPITDALTRHSDVQLLFPDLFDGLDDERVWIIGQVCAANIHEGWVPTRDEVAAIIARDNDAATRRES